MISNSLSLADMFGRTLSGGGFLGSGLQNSPAGLNQYYGNTAGTYAGTPVETQRITTNAAELNQYEYLKYQDVAATSTSNEENRLMALRRIDDMILHYGPLLNQVSQPPLIDGVYSGFNPAPIVEEKGPKTRPVEEKRVLEI